MDKKFFKIEKNGSQPVEEENTFVVNTFVKAEKDSSLDNMVSINNLNNEDKKVEKPQISQMILNPVAEDKPDEFEKEDYANVFTINKIIIGMLFNPGKTLDKNNQKFRNFISAITIFLSFIAIILVLSLISKFIVDIFPKEYDIYTETYNVSYNLANFSVTNLIPRIIKVLSVSASLLIIVAGIYYLSSFFNSLGVSFSRYMIITICSFVPLYLVYFFVAPIINILSIKVSNIIMLLAIIYTIICFIVGIVDNIKFKNTNQKIILNMVNIIIILIVIAEIFILGKQISLNFLEYLI